MQEIAINRLWTEKEYKEGGKVVSDLLANRLVFAKIVVLHGHVFSYICNMLIALLETAVNPSQVLDGSTTDPGTDICKRALLHARWHFEDKNDGL